MTDSFATHLTRLRAYALRPATRRDPKPGEIEAFEAELGRTLPEPYRSFLARWGRHALSSVPRFDLDRAEPARSGCISQFFGFSTDGSSDLVKATREPYAGRVPDDTVPIGRDPGSGLVLLGIAGPRRGQVFASGVSAPVAETFGEFLQMLRPDPLYDE
ncbi:MAG: SMI1/KNR4 family protein [Archangiaceae bacterium]|nr:SMI1/KNR4 family protein [Archangiaceae bacterium]